MSVYMSIKEKENFANFWNKQEGDIDLNMEIARCAIEVLNKPPITQMPDIKEMNRELTKTISLLTKELEKLTKFKETLDTKVLKKRFTNKITEVNKVFEEFKTASNEHLPNTEATPTEDSYLTQAYNAVVNLLSGEAGGAAGGAGAPGK